MIFEFRKFSKILGVQAGYYFKNEFLSRYKTEALMILRQRIESAGNKIGDKSRMDFDKGKEVLKDEWQVLHDENQKMTNRIKKTDEKKKPYYAQLKLRSMRHEIFRLQEKIKWYEQKKMESINDWDSAISQKQKQIEEIENFIKSTENQKNDPLQQFIGQQKGTGQATASPKTEVKK